MESRNYKKLIKFIIIAVLIIGIIITFLKTKINVIEIEGNQKYSNEEIISMIFEKEIDKYSPVLFIKNKMKLTNCLPQIDYVDIELTGINSIKVYVYEKIIVGCVKMMDNFMFFDKDGIVTESSKEQLDKIPLVTGLEFNNILVGKKLVIDDDMLFKRILDISLALKKFDFDVERIHFSTDNSIILFFDESRALLGIKDSYDEELKALINLSKNNQFASYEYDFRYFDSEEKRVIGKPIE